MRLLPVGLVDGVLRVEVPGEVVTDEEVVAATVAGVAFQRVQQRTVVVLPEHPIQDQPLRLLEARIRLELRSVQFNLTAEMEDERTDAKNKVYTSPSCLCLRRPGT